MGALPPPPREIEPEAARLFREAAARAEFDFRVFRFVGIVGGRGWKDAARAAIPRMPTPTCGVFIRFFMVRDPVPSNMLESAMGGAEVLAAFERAGLAVRTEDGHWQCPFVLIPAASVLAFSDAIDDPASENPPDEYIIPISGSSRFVDDLAVRAPCELAVDMGCGQGFHALRSLIHAQRCIATDINPRAVAFARTNASLNGAGARIECRQGSFFEPLGDVAGKVDLLTCNPPFVIQPGVHTTAAASPTEGDGMLEHLVRTAPQMLRDGAWATIIGIWEHADMSDWVSRIRGWVEGSGCDALALQFRTYRPDEYLQNWIAPEVRPTVEQGWRALCQSRGIGAVTYGGFILHKRAGFNWFRSLYTLINIRSGAASEQLQAYFSTQTALPFISSPAALLDCRLRISPGWRFDPNLAMPKAAPMGVPRGLAIPLQNAAQHEPLLTAFDGVATARQVLAKLHQAGRITLAPEHPSTIGLVQAFVANGCLDIVG